MRNTSGISFPKEERKFRKTVTVWVNRHPTSLFFALTFLYSWSILAVVAFIPFENETAYHRWLGITGFGPAISAIAISSMLFRENRQPGKSHRVPVIRTILLSLLVFFLIAGAELWNNAWWSHAYDASLVLADAVLVTLATVVILWLFSDQGQSRRQLLGEEGGCVVFLWITIALVLWPVLFLAGNWIAGRLGSSLSPDPIYPDLPLAPVVIQSLVWAFLFGGPLGEEPGWRGFALPRLQYHFNPLAASVIIGSLWGLWHVPEHFMNAYGGGAFGAIIRIQEIPRAILFTWLYNRSKGSLLVVLLFHASVNTTVWFLPRSYAIVLFLCTLLAAILAIKDRMWEKLPVTIKGI